MPGNLYFYNWLMDPIPKDGIGEDIHIWRIALDVSESRDVSSSLMSSDEILRMNAYKFEPPRRQFAVARTALRRILGGYLNEKPEKVVITYGAQGKPFIMNASFAGIHFNLAHSGNLALLAITSGKEVGIDLEFNHSLNDMATLSRDYFHSSEFDWIFGQITQKQLEAFYQIWTRKEAVIKAIGVGLSMPLNSFSVLDSQRLFELDAFSPLLIGGSRFDVVSFNPQNGYVGALALQI